MSRKSFGLKWKVGASYSVLILFLGALVIAAVFYFTLETLRQRFERHQLAIATSFSDSTSGYLASKNFLALHVLASKYSLLEGAAYAFVRNSGGNIIAHSFGTIPESLRQGLPRDPGRAVQRRDLALSGRGVREIAVPVLGGQLGVVHVGFYADALEAELRQSLIPVLGVLAGLFLIGIVLSFALAHWLVRPIRHLSTIAERITRGDLESVELSDRINSRDEIGALASSLERMRSSLKAALSRLAREVS